MKTLNTSDQESRAAAQIQHTTHTPMVMGGWFDGEIINDSDYRVKLWSDDRMEEGGSLESGLFWQDAHTRSDPDEDIDHVRDIHGRWYKIGVNVATVNEQGYVHGAKCRSRSYGQDCAEDDFDEGGTGGPEASDAGIPLPGGVQPKLEVNQPGDPFEQEADAVADKVMRSETAVQRKCAACAEEEEVQMKPLVQMKTSSPEGGKNTPSWVEQQIHNSRGNGQSLPDQTRSFMENSIGAGFQNVKVHTDNTAVQMNRELGARAFTVGSDIYFNSGQYAPESSEGKRLLAHELTHTVQQQNGPTMVNRTLGDGHDLLAERFQGRLDLEAAFDNEAFMRRGSSGPDVVILQLALIEAGHPLPDFGADGDFGPETERAVIDFQAANGLQTDGIVGPETMGALDALFTVGPVIIPVCNNPGVARNVLLQPVFFRCGTNDADPTGSRFFDQLTKANEIWSKLGVTFTTASPVTLNDCTHKTSGTTEAEQNAIGNLHTGAGVEVYYVDNNLAGAGGGSTLSAGANSNVVLSDFGTSLTLLAHELGHVLGLDHPPGGADAGTIMQPSGSHSIENPERNTLANLVFITFPAGTDPICLTPDI